MSVPSLKNTPASSQEAFGVMHRLQSMGILCDLEIQTSTGHMFKVHKIVMVATCSFFQNLLWKSEHNQFSSVSFPNLDHVTLGYAIKFVYGERITPANTEALYQAARTLGIPELIKKCEDILMNLKSFYMKDNVRKETGLDVMHENVEVEVQEHSNDSDHEDMLTFHIKTEHEDKSSLDTVKEHEGNPNSNVTKKNQALKKHVTTNSENSDDFLCKVHHISPCKVVIKKSDQIQQSGALVLKADTPGLPPYIGHACQECTAVLRSRQGLLMHMKFQHPDVINNYFPYCQPCCKSFLTAELYDRHACVDKNFRKDAKSAVRHCGQGRRLAESNSSLEKHLQGGSEKDDDREKCDVGNTKSVRKQDIQKERTTEDEDDVWNDDGDDVGDGDEDGVGNGDHIGDGDYVVDEDNVEMCTIDVGEINSEQVDSEVEKNCLGAENANDESTTVHRACNVKGYSLRKSRTLRKYVNDSSEDEDEMDIFDVQEITTEDVDAEEDKGDVSIEKDGVFNNEIKAKPEPAKRQRKMLKKGGLDKEYKPHWPTRKKKKKVISKKKQDGPTKKISKPRIRENIVRPARKFSCNICSVFLTQRNLALHNVNVHNTGKTFTRNVKCSECDLDFLFKDLLIEHCKAQHNMKVIVCEDELCNETFSSDYKYKKHKSEVHGDDLHYCPFCPFTDKFKIKVANHMAKDHKKCLECKTCGETFLTLTVLRKHEKNQHGEVVKEVLKCSECDYTTEVRKEFFEHKVMHKKERKRKCKICDIWFKFSEQLDVHNVEVHAAQPTYRSVCYKCGKKFIAKRRLAAHLRFCGVVERQLKCSVCNFTSNSRHMLQVHEYRKHKILAENKKVFKCESCDYTSINKTFFAYHVKTHTKNYDYWCDQCEKGFHFRHAFTEHQLRHKGAKKYFCSKCPYGALSQSDVFKHERLMHTLLGLKPFKCAYCDYTTSQRVTCMNHTSRLHPQQTRMCYQVLDLENGKPITPKALYAKRQPSNFKAGNTVSASATMTQHNEINDAVSSISDLDIGNNLFNTQQGNTASASATMMQHNEINDAVSSISDLDIGNNLFNIQQEGQSTSMDY